MLFFSFIPFYIFKKDSFFFRDFATQTVLEKQGALLFWPTLRQAISFGLTITFTNKKPSFN